MSQPSISMPRPAPSASGGGGLSFALLEAFDREALAQLAAAPSATAPNRNEASASTPASGVRGSQQHGSTQKRLQQRQSSNINTPSSPRLQAQQATRRPSGKRRPVVHKATVPAEPPPPPLGDDSLQVSNTLAVSSRTSSVKSVRFTDDLIAPPVPSAPSPDYHTISQSPHRSALRQPKYFDVPPPIDASDRSATTPRTDASSSPEPHHHDVDLIPPPPPEESDDPHYMRRDGFLVAMEKLKAEKERQHAAQCPFSPRVTKKSRELAEKYRQKHPEARIPTPTRSNRRPTPTSKQTAPEPAAEVRPNALLRTASATNKGRADTFRRVPFHTDPELDAIEFESNDDDYENSSEYQAPSIASSNHSNNNNRFPSKGGAQQQQHGAKSRESSKAAATFRRFMEWDAQRREKLEARREVAEAKRKAEELRAEKEFAAAPSFKMAPLSRRIVAAASDRRLTCLDHATMVAAARSEKIRAKTPTSPRSGHKASTARTGSKSPRGGRVAVSGVSLSTRSLQVATQHQQQSRAALGWWLDTVKSDDAYVRNHK